MKGRLGYRKKGVSVDITQMYFEVKNKNTIVKPFWMVPFTSILSVRICILHIKWQLCKSNQNGSW